MSKARGLRLQNALARYLVPWWQYAESAGPGRPGTDVTNTPGGVWETKTADEFRPLAWVRQAQAHKRGGNALAITVYWPRGVGEAQVTDCLAILRLEDVMMLLEQADYTDRHPLRDLADAE
jgi:hypothetical protein